MSYTTPSGTSGFQDTLVKAILALTFAIAAGAASGSATFMVIVFAITLFVTLLGAAAMLTIASKPWGEKPAILIVAIGRSIVTAALGVAVFGVLLGGSVALNEVIADFRMRELDVWIGILPFVGIIGYCMMIPTPGQSIRRSPIRLLTRGVIAAALAAVVLYMLHAIVNIVGLA